MHVLVAANLPPACSFQNIVGRPFIADFEQQATLDEIGKIAADGFGANGGVALLEIAVRDALFVGDLDERSDLAFIEAKFSPFAQITIIERQRIGAVALQYDEEAGGGFAERGRGEPSIFHLAQHAINAVAKPFDQAKIGEHLHEGFIA